MIEVGDVIEISGQEAMVCFLTTHNDHKYLLASFDEDKVRYEAYEYTDNDNKLLVGKVEDEEELKEVLGIFFSEGIDQYGVPDDIKEGLLKFLNQ